MGLKDSIQQVLAKILRANADSKDPVVSQSQLSTAATLGPDSLSPAKEANLAALEAKIDYAFRRRELLVNALLHRSHIHVTGQERTKSNERLEFLGDAVLGLIANEELYHRYPDRSEGDLTKMKSLLVCGARLAEVAITIDLGQHISLSRSEEATGGRLRASILADTTEAVIGAVYLDGGLSAARRVIDRIVLQGSEKVVSQRSQLNYKSRLQEIIQSRYKSPPRYQVVSVSGPDHDRIFCVQVVFRGEVLGTGDGSNKKAAEQSAARMALETLASVEEMD